MPQNISRSSLCLLGLKLSTAKRAMVDRLQRFHMVAKESDEPHDRVPSRTAVLSVLSADNRLSFVEPPPPPHPRRWRHMTVAERTGRDGAGAF